MAGSHVAPAGFSLAARGDGPRTGGGTGIPPADEAGREPPRRPLRKWIYGLVSYWVTQRTFEIGVRVAMGASRQRVVSMILGHGLRVALCGIGAGIVAALAVTRFLASLLYGVGATDPLTFAALIFLIFGIATTATAFPAWRSARIDPVKSLRVD